MKKKIIIIVIILCVFSFKVLPDQTLKTLIIEKNWKALAPLFKDTSHATLRTYFSNYQDINIKIDQSSRLIYQVKFDKYGEIGVILYEKKENKYLNLKITNQIKPLYFIKSIKRYTVKNLKIDLGDAQIHFKTGVFFQMSPFDSLFLFDGRWTFYIKPEDNEERLTLKRQFKKDYFSRSPGKGIFIIQDREFLKKLPNEGEEPILNKELDLLFRIYRDNFGIKMDAFEEHWYLPFSKDLALCIFQKDKRFYYTYSYDQGMVPDTRLILSDNQKMILSYNASKGLKISMRRPQKVSHLYLNLYLNPIANYLSGNTNITYKTPASLRILKLAKGINLVGNLQFYSRELNIFRKNDLCYLLGPMDDQLSLYFKGYIASNEDSLEIFQRHQGQRRSDKREDNNRFYFLSKTRHFYPNPENKFFKSNVTITLPKGFECLVSGNLVEKKEGEVNTYSFTSPGTKGISLATGTFKLTKQLGGKLPINFYTFESFRYPKRLDLSEVKDALDLFMKSFGPIDLSKINIILKRDDPEGGISNNGFIVVNIPPVRNRPLISTPAEYSLSAATSDGRILSPILIRNQSEDHILHELAHQWWGGVISWNSYQDVWITEGLSHFSVLYYLKKKMSERRFNRIIRKLKRWIYKYNDTGPIIYGTRIDSLENSYEAYQSINYNKSALVFLMLMELLGEKNFSERLRSVVKKYKYQSITSTQFIRQFAKKNKTILNFFNNWIFSRATPTVKLELAEDHKDYDKKEFKQIVISIKQLYTNYIFPLKLKVTAKKGSSIESIVLKMKEQTFIIKRDSPIRSINVADSVTLVKEKKEAPPR
jgi:hypothetical protein